MEGEHAGTIRKAVGLPANPPPPAYDPPPDLKELAAEVKRRETRIGDFCQRALAEASEERVRGIFTYLIEIEADHLALAERTLGY